MPTASAEPRASENADDCGWGTAVEEEIAVAEEAQRKAKQEARKELHKARVEKTKADAHAKVEEMKAKLHRPKADASA